MRLGPEYWLINCRQNERPHLRLKILQESKRNICYPSVSECMLLTDNGSENYGEVKQWIKASDIPKINHVIAQADIPFSNSMIEAANKQLKYRFLYHRKINDYFRLGEYLDKAILDFNHRPHAILNGLTLIEVLQGKSYNNETQNNFLSLAKQKRILENQNEMLLW